MVDLEFADFFPKWNLLSDKTQRILQSFSQRKKLSAGEVLHNGDTDCVGVVLVKKGQLRAFITSDMGKEVTLYRLFERDICLFSASCIMRSIEFDITVETEKNTDFWLIPSDVYKNLMENSLVLSNYTNEVMSARFSDVMYIIDQILFKSMDERIAHFLLNESNLENTRNLKITHEQIAHHIGTAREVVTRILKYLQAEEIISIRRGGVLIKNLEKLEQKVK